MLYVFNILSRVTFSISRVLVMPKRLWCRYCDAAALHRSRCDLSELTPRELDDIGVSKEQAETEAKRPFFSDSAPWLTETVTLHGEYYHSGRPQSAMRSSPHKRSHHQAIT